MIAFCFHQILIELYQRVFILWKFALLSFVQFILFLEFLGWFYFTWCSFCSDIKEIYVGLKKTLLEKFDRLRLGSNFLLQFEVIIFSLEISSTSCHILFMLSKSVVNKLFSILFYYCSFRSV